ncbi:hypothetical protein [Clostridium sardiniense]|uniref:hypothetical protein n=1 Tax=Clostridium sardiniense TaxID=29369 RepID=UPI00195B851E|nr:hypothetical protein [Clostridium sardiniense]MBM7833220.1 hypothetical protein [Clostridium sardiniense]
MNYENFNQLDETTLSNANGGSIAATIVTIGGVIVAVNEVYKFGQGVVNGWNNYK